MGSCISSSHVASPQLPPLVTTKLVLPNGGLIQFSRPIMASHVLGKDESACFVCDSDTMETDRDLTEISKDKVLRLGQIYFVLPRSMLNRPLKGTEMAQLAVRGSLALSQGGGLSRSGRRRMVAPLDFAAEEVKEDKATKKGGGKRKSFKFVPHLMPIAE